ncbi:MAG TPA: glycosyl hydrolase family 65 protein, partial [Aggregatilineales bacterium]|nr:glycosyl hydrolase family 65 protein [Aggregatilineales bacterium]
DIPGLEGTYLNGFYESQVIQYPEVAYAFAKNSQTMLNVTNGKVIRLFLDDEPFTLGTGTVKDYRRVLKLRDGVLERELIWRSPGGKEIKLAVKRLVSLQHKHLAAIRYQVTPLNFSGTIRLVSELDGDVTNLTSEDDPRRGSGLKGRVLSVERSEASGGYGVLVQRTTNSHLVLACAMENVLETKAPHDLSSFTGEFTAEVEYTVRAVQNQPIRLDKFIAYVTTQDYDEGELLDAARPELTRAKQAGFEALEQEQIDFLRAFWADADIVITGDTALQQGIRFNIFHLLQAVGRDGKTNICAKGLTGEGYEGHYFWDTETFVVPFFLFNDPTISRRLLEYRYNTLPKARRRAREMSHKNGALFPWRTINGDECSAYFEAGTAQYHIDADIALAVKRYVEATQDERFLLDGGAEIVFETARLWVQLGAFMPRKGSRFCINEVTGPDEYSALVNNNCYTNLMAKENLHYAWSTAQWMKANAPTEYQRLAAKIQLEDGEPAAWQQAADRMYVPYDDETKLYLQDDSFLDRVPWDFANTPEDAYPLLIHYHPLVIYRHQVCKQADLVLALFMLGDKFTTDEKRRNYDFYERVTTHDSSLSTCIFSIVASEIGYYDKAYRYFMNTARMDLDDYHGNTKDGVHIANMAGTWMCLVNGFAGLRVYDGMLRLNPYLPGGWEDYSFKLHFRGRLVSVTVNRAQTHYTLLSGDDLEIAHGDQRVRLTSGATVSVDNVRFA